MFSFRLAVAIVCIFAQFISEYSTVSTRNYAGQRETTLKTTGVKDLKGDSAPYQCSLQRSSQHFCSCVIVAPEWILTAAHCFKKYVSEIRIMK